MHRFLVPFLLVTIGFAGCGNDGNGGPMGGQGGDGGDGATGGDGGQGGTGGSLACDEQMALAGDVGGACRGDTFTCDQGLACLGEQVFEFGPDIVNHPEGMSHTFEVVDFPGNYCTAALVPASADPNRACTQANVEACAAGCALCVPRYTDADICLRGCRAEADTNSTCRPGYQCDLLAQVCDTGCSTDDECRVFINENEELEYDTESTFVCNLQTHRCEHPGTLGAEAGIECANSQQCEANGICLDDEFFGFPEGYCSKIRCDIDPCAGDALCLPLLSGVPMCAESCQVGTGVDPEDPSSWLNNTQGCRAGYTCFWAGVANDTTGACVPGVYNDVTENNIGEVCTDTDESSECWSPFGQGACEPSIGCTVFDCAVPEMPPELCGADAECVLDPGSGVSLCLKKCTSAEDCVPGAACGGIDEDPLTLDTVCFPACRDNTECRANETCMNIVNGFGECG